MRGHQAKALGDGRQILTANVPAPSDLLGRDLHTENLGVETAIAAAGELAGEGAELTDYERQGNQVGHHASASFEAKRRANDRCRTMWTFGRPKCIITLPRGCCTFRAGLVRAVRLRASQEPARGLCLGPVSFCRFQCERPALRRARRLSLTHCTRRTGDANAGSLLAAIGWGANHGDGPPAAWLVASYSARMRACCAGSSATPWSRASSAQRRNAQARGDSVRRSAA